jgi:8-oxo-dGTP pyrophosphatase MutT (NUDIX family)
VHRQDLLEVLSLYGETWGAGIVPYPTFAAAEESAHVAAIRSFVEAKASCFERSEPSGHITGAALVVSPGLDRVLLTLHAKLGLWLQLGGHADGDPAVERVALREAEEESGLTGLTLLPYEEQLGALAGRQLASPLPFDMDFHQIPPRKAEPAHVHYDIRYLVVADPARSLTITNESKDLRWFAIPEAKRLTAERSMQRQFEKLEWLQGILNVREAVDRRPSNLKLSEAPGNF